MKPYFEDAQVTLYHGDCRDVLPQLRADCVIGDPPYGAGAYRTDVAVPTEVYRALVERYRTVALFGYPEALAGVSVTLGRPPGEWVVWWPTNAVCKSGQRSAGLSQEHEAVAVFGAVPGARHLTRPRIQDASTLRIHAGRGSSLRDARMGDVWRDASPGIGFNAHQRRHPNEKPLDLLCRLVTMCSVPGETVLDPWAGSGTTLRAAKDLGRKAIGVEIEERYCEVIVQRLAQQVLPLDHAS